MVLNSHPQRVSHAHLTFPEPPDCLQDACHGDVSDTVQQNTDNPRGTMHPIGCYSAASKPKLIDTSMVTLDMKPTEGFCELRTDLCLFSLGSDFKPRV